ncbi:M23 family metallopeptidase [Sphingomonas montanisoli]|uniref:M23 family metallopeptidase n=1 Tax=Sphingomonas montanisoli TaxID=2606412 RepID=A0A5D9C873_9SPHN|nr:M23 family metallopeptidase [Sphingomonas montanisoli]TZG26211.1 M23 family metallopeptidase [Sphingomonas montanisoli]
MRIIHRIAIILLVAVIFYVGWVIYLNLPGADTPQPKAMVGPAKTIAAPAAPEQVVPAKGPLLIPVAGVTAAQLQDTFTDARGDGSRSHGALDIMAPRGTPVLAAAAGTVEKLFTSKLGGLTIYIRRPGGGWVDYYAHLDHYAPDLAEGQNVARGQTIGAVGFTGDASPEGPHLHYEIKAMAPGESWWQGKAVNPYAILSGK